MNNYDTPSQNFPLNQNPTQSSREFMQYPGWDLRIDKQNALLKKLVTLQKPLKTQRKITPQPVDLTIIAFVNA